ncbi:MAG TPA: phosphatase PAP2 family protein [Candidatus Sulfotelmatobacter sp.]|nr:phosphatase PAP2 family protein [Candidatus Sulfotelmatobacter sp.]
MKPRYWHYWISLLLLLAMVPILRHENLPLRFDWITLGIAYWFLLAAQSIFAAVILCLIGVPRERVVEPFLQRYRENPLRCIPLLLFVAILIGFTGWLRGMVLSVDAMALLEVVNRRRAALHKTAAAILAPAAYLFFGFLMVLAYNNVIVSMRYNFLYDPALANIDRWLLHGHSVWEFSHWALRAFPFSFFKAAEFIYFGMFLQIGATMIFLAMSEGRTRALQFVGTILMSYYLALIIFYICPAQGPYSLCPGHFSRFPPSLQAYNIQKTLIPHALALWHHAPVSRISTDYFIGFPCMHLVQPLVVLWFLRPRRRIVIALAAYDIFLLIAILMLEMHYAIDILVALPVAAIAIAITDVSFRGKNVAAPLSPSRMLP